MIAAYTVCGAAELVDRRPPPPPCSRIDRRSAPDRTGTCGMVSWMNLFPIASAPALAPSRATRPRIRSSEPTTSPATAGLLVSVGLRPVHGHGGGQQERADLGGQLVALPRLEAKPDQVHDVVPVAFAQAVREAFALPGGTPFELEEVTSFGSGSRVSR